MTVITADINLSWPFRFFALPVNINGCISLQRGSTFCGTIERQSWKHECKMRSVLFFLFTFPLSTTHLFQLC